MIPVNAYAAKGTLTPLEPIHLKEETFGKLLENGRTVIGSMINDTAEIQERLDYCVEHHIV